MSWDEHIMLIAHTVNVYGDRLKVRLWSNTGASMAVVEQPAHGCRTPRQRSCDSCLAQFAPVWPSMCNYLKLAVVLKCCMCSLCLTGDRQHRQ